MIRPGLLPSRFAPLLTSLAAMAAALILGGVFLAMRGKDPIAAYGMLISRGLGTSYGITETLIRMAPLLIVSAGLLISLRAGVWNIGIDGQLMVGALFSGVALDHDTGVATLGWRHGGTSSFEFAWPDVAP